MDLVAKIDFIRDRAGVSVAGDPSAVLWSTHAVQRLVVHTLRRGQVESALVDCELVENYSQDHRALPDCLVLGIVAGATEPVHAVVAIDEARRRILIVTVYRPSPTRWMDDWKSRR